MAPWCLRTAPRPCARTKRPWIAGSAWPCTEADMRTVADMKKPRTQGAARAAKASPTPAPQNRARSEPARQLPDRRVIDLDHYAPAYLTWIANKLSRGASQHYLSLFDVGIETWRCLVL